MYCTIRTDLRNSQQLHHLLGQPLPSKQVINRDKIQVRTKTANRKFDKRSTTGNTSQVLWNWRTIPYPREELDNSFILSNN